MLGTVRGRILLFAFLSLFALCALAALSWTVITRAETASEQLVRNSLEASWLLEDFERSYYEVGKVIDFRLFSTLDPMMTAISERKQAIRQAVDSGSSELLAFLELQRFRIVAGSLGFLVLVVAMTLWLRHSVIGCLRKVAEDPV